EKFKIESGDKIKTDKRIEVTITFGDDIKLKIGESTTVDMGDFIVSTVPGDSRVKIKEPLIPDLSVGTLTAIINKLKPRTKFEIHTPNCVTCARGTIFSLWTDGNTTSLTVVEGEVEFSDLKGNKTIVKSNQICICSKEQGLQKPVTLPIDSKK
ncbi:MAG: FecR domain-containing protein, partial [Bacteroidales bacterium]